MKFVIDAQLLPALAQRLRAAGHVETHVEDLALRNADDEAIREYAIRNGCVLVTKDRDFVPVGSFASESLQVLWIRTGNVSNRILYSRLEAGWARVIEHLEASARIVELR